MTVLDRHRGLESAVPVSRLIALADLPVGRTEIELSDPPEWIELANGMADATKIMALVRLHSHPMGVVMLDGTLGDRWSDHLPAVRSAVGAAVDAHLATDWCDGDTADEWPACMVRRAAALAVPPSASVVVATRERADSLRECLNSLIALNYPDYEIIVVDNDPQTPDTAEMVAREFGEDVRYVREANRGLACAHNRGLAEVSGDIVAFVDDDVVADRHWLDAIVEGFAAAGDVGCVTGLILPAEIATPAQLLLEKHGGFDKGLDLKVFDSDLNRPDDPLFPFTAGRLGSGANMAFDTSVLRGLGGFDAAIGAGTYARGGDDLAAFFRVVLDHRLVYQPAAVVWHRHHRELEALRNQAFGYGVGLSAYLTSVLIKEPRTWPALLRRLPAGLRFAFGTSSERNRRYDGLPDELAALERRGMLSGPAAYAVSRWRSRRNSGGDLRA